MVVHEPVHGRVAVLGVDEPSERWATRLRASGIGLAVDEVDVDLTVTMVSSADAAVRLRLTSPHARGRATVTTMSWSEAATAVRMLVRMADIGSALTEFVHDVLGRDDAELGFLHVERESHRDLFRDGRHQLVDVRGTIPQHVYVVAHVTDHAGLADAMSHLPSRTPPVVWCLPPPAWDRAPSMGMLFAAVAEPDGDQREDAVTL